MSVSATITVWCDEEGCPEWIGQEPTGKEARKRAKIFGWQTNVPDHSGNRRRDYCPEHRKDKK